MCIRDRSSLVEYSKCYINDYRRGNKANAMTSLSIEDKKQKAAAWFKDLQNQICASFERIETELQSDSPAVTFDTKDWQRENSDKPNESGSILKGGGIMAVMKGRVFEKVGVNFSQVHGTFSDDFAAKIPGATESNGEFWASGISLVAHMRSPLVPAVHMNTRMIATSKSWFGGGADLTPMFEDEQDTSDFHTAFKDCCDAHGFYLHARCWKNIS